MKTAGVLLLCVSFLIIGGCVKHGKPDYPAPVHKCEPYIPELGAEAEELVIEQIDSEQYRKNKRIIVLKTIRINKEKDIKRFLSFFVDTATANMPIFSTEFIITVKMGKSEFKLFLSRHFDICYWGDEKNGVRGYIIKKEFVGWLNANFAKD